MTIERWLHMPDKKDIAQIVGMILGMRASARFNIWPKIEAKLKTGEFTILEAKKWDLVIADRSGNKMSLMNLVKWNEVVLHSNQWVENVEQLRTYFEEGEKVLLMDQTWTDIVVYKEWNKYLTLESAWKPKEISFNDIESSYIDFEMVTTELAAVNASTDHVSMINKISEFLKKSLLLPKKLYESLKAKFDAYVNKYLADINKALANQISKKTLEDIKNQLDSLAAPKKNIDKTFNNYEKSPSQKQLDTQMKRVEKQTVFELQVLQAQDLMRSVDATLLTDSMKVLLEAKDISQLSSNDIKRVQREIWTSVDGVWWNQSLNRLSSYFDSILSGNKNHVNTQETWTWRNDNNLFVWDRQAQKEKNANFRDRMLNRTSRNKSPSKDITSKENENDIASSELVTLEKDAVTLETENITMTEKVTRIQNLVDKVKALYEKTLSFVKKPNFNAILVTIDRLVSMVQKDIPQGTVVASFEALKLQKDILKTRLEYIKNKKSQKQVSEDDVTPIETEDIPVVERSTFNLERSASKWKNNIEKTTTTEIIPWLWTYEYSKRNDRVRMAIKTPYGTMEAESRDVTTNEYVLHAAIGNNRLAAGKAYKFIFDKLPEWAKIREKSNLSWDSYTNLLNLYKKWWSTDCKIYVDGTTKLNLQWVNSDVSKLIISQGVEWIFYSSTKENAQVVIDMINKELKPLWLPEATLMKHDAQNPEYFIKVPNFVLEKTPNTAFELATECKNAVSFKQLEWIMLTPKYENIQFTDVQLSGKELLSRINEYMLGKMDIWYIPRELRPSIKELVKKEKQTTPDALVK